MIFALYLSLLNVFSTKLSQEVHTLEVNKLLLLLTKTSVLTKGQEYNLKHTGLSSSLDGI
jgi:hypothetical protein